MSRMAHTGILRRGRGNIAIVKIPDRCAGDGDWLAAMGAGAAVAGILIAHVGDRATMGTSELDRHS